MILSRSTWGGITGGIQSVPKLLATIWSPSKQLTKSRKVSKLPRVYQRHSSVRHFCVQIITTREQQGGYGTDPIPTSPFCSSGEEQKCSSTSNPYQDTFMNPIPTCMRRVDPHSPPCPDLFLFQWTRKKGGQWKNGYGIKIKKYFRIWCITLYLNLKKKNSQYTNSLFGWWVCKKENFYL